MILPSSSRSSNKVISHNNNGNKNKIKTKITVTVIIYSDKSRRSVQVASAVDSIVIVTVVQKTTKLHKSRKALVLAIMEVRRNKSKSSGCKIVRVIVVLRRQNTGREPEEFQVLLGSLRFSYSG